MKKYFYWKIASSSFFLPSVYILFVYGSSLPDAVEFFSAIGKWLANIHLTTRDLTMMTALYILNMLYVFIRTDFSDYISDLYDLKVGFEIESINYYAEQINSMDSPFKGKVHSYNYDAIKDSLEKMDSKIRTHLDVEAGFQLFSDDNNRQKLRGECELPLAVRRSHSRVHRYRLKKSEAMLHFDYPAAPNHFQTYIKLKDSHDIDLFDFRINILKGLRNGGTFLISPAYEQLVLEDINSRGEKKVVIELVCFIPFVFFPRIAIEKVLYCFKVDNHFYPIAYARLEPL